MKTLYGADVSVGDLMNSMKYMIECANARLDWYKDTRESRYYKDFSDYMDAALVYKKSIDMIMSEDCTI